jgi:uncharacterized protein YjbI with pentapeptide repeats
MMAATDRRVYQMADQQLKRLEQGVKRWNQWRKEHPDEHVDLSKANLLGVDLRGADLSNADLTKTRVTEEQLKKAKSLDLATMPDGSKQP